MHEPKKYLMVLTCNMLTCDFILNSNKDASLCSLYWEHVLCSYQCLFATAHKDDFQTKHVSICFFQTDMVMVGWPLPPQRGKNISVYRKHWCDTCNDFVILLFQVRFTHTDLPLGFNVLFIQGLRLKEKLIPVLNLLTESSRVHRETRHYLRQKVV